MYPLWRKGDDDVAGKQFGDSEDDTPMPPDAEKMTIGRPKKKARAPTTVTTTARKGKKRQAKCVAGSRVSITRKLLKTHIDFESDAFSSIKGLSDDLLLYGTVIESKLRGSFVVRFELLPTNNQLVTVTRSHLTTVDKNAEEPEYRHLKSVEAITEIEGGDEEWEDEEAEEAASKKPTRKKNPWIESQENCLSLPDDVRASSKTFEHFYGTKPDEKIVWKILQDNEQITTDAMGEHNDKLYHPIKVDISWSPTHKDVNYNQTFFWYFFPSLKAKAKLMDEYLADCRCSMYTTVVSNKIQFYDPDREDPDALVRLCVTILIIGALEVHNGIKNLWKSGLLVQTQERPTLDNVSSFRSVVQRDAHKNDRCPLCSYG